MWPRVTRKQGGLFLVARRGRLGEAQGGPVPHDVTCTAGVGVWGQTGIREAQSCGFNCCRGETKTRRTSQQGVLRGLVDPGRLAGGERVNVVYIWIFIRVCCL